MAGADEVTLITNGIVVTMDPQRRIIDGGAVAIEKDRIIDVGVSSDLEAKYRPQETIDATNMAVLPGLINAHTHVGLHLCRGLGDDIDLLEAHQKIYFPFGWHPRAEVAPEYVFQASMLACLELITSGTTCIVDQNPQPQEVARAVDTAGLRGGLSGAMMDTWLGGEDIPALADRGKLVAEAKEFIEQWNGKGEGRIQARVGPVHEMFCSKELFADVVKVADQYGVGINVHLAETRTEVEAAKAHYGKRSVEYAYDVGILRPLTIIGHACWLSERDITLLAKSGASVAHTPVCEMKLSSGITPAPRLIEAGVNVTLGTDAAGQCNGANDIIREMKVATLLHKVNYPLDPEVLPAEVVLEMVTLNAAKAMGLENEIGSLEKGKKADLILLDLKKPHLIPVLRKPKLNVVSLLVYSAVGPDVDTTIVNGRVLMLHRKVLSLDADRVLDDSQAVATEMMEKTGIANMDIPWRWQAAG